MPQLVKLARKGQSLLDQFRVLMLTELKMAEIFANLLVAFNLLRACANDSLVDLVLWKRKQLRECEVDLNVDEESCDIYADYGGFHVILPFVYLTVIGVALSWQ